MGEAYRGVPQEGKEREEREIKNYIEVKLEPEMTAFNVADKVSNVVNLGMLSTLWSALHQLPLGSKLWYRVYKNPKVECMMYQCRIAESLCTLRYHILVTDCFKHNNYYGYTLFIQAVNIIF